MVKNQKKKKKESGQAIVEFAFVLPIFLLLVMGILDFGFFFYNYISAENAARNAARVACVEYDNVAYTKEANGTVNKVLSRTLTLPSENAELVSSYKNASVGEPGSEVNPYAGYTDEEIDICVKVAESIQKTGIDKADRTVIIDYTYDTSEDVITNGNWSKSKRFKGDVVVTVKGKAHVLTPVLGVFSDGMKKEISASSTFKVEEQYSDTTAGS